MPIESTPTPPLPNLIQSTQPILEHLQVPFFNIDLADASSNFYKIANNAPASTKSTSVILATSSVSPTKKSVVFSVVGAHPNVAKVFSTSSDANVVMEYIHGINVSVFISLLKVLKVLGVLRSNCSKSVVHDTLGGLPLFDSLSVHGLDNLDIQNYEIFVKTFPETTSIGNWSTETILNLTLGVEFLHKQNLVHRDLVSTNIMIEPDLEQYFSNGMWVPRRLIITGFSRMGRLSDPLTLLKFTNVNNKPVHLAPENFCDVEADIDYGVDTYSLGVLFKDLWNQRIFSQNCIEAPDFVKQMVAANVDERIKLERVVDYLKAV